MRETFETEKKPRLTERREKEEWSNFTGGAGQRLINSSLALSKFISFGVEFSLRDILCHFGILFQSSEERNGCKLA